MSTPIDSPVRVWLGCHASIFAHRGYKVRGGIVHCADFDDARNVVARALGPDTFEGPEGHWYTSVEACERDEDGSAALAVIYSD